MAGPGQQLQSDLCEALQFSGGLKLVLKPDMLRAFLAVADHGNLAGAATALGRTPSAVSMMLKSFEDHIGAPLFVSARKSQLTPLGAMIETEARRALAQFDTSTSLISALAGATAGIVRLAVTPSVATSVLPPVLQQFVQNRPGVRIDLRDMDSAGVLGQMKQDRADIGIGTFDPVPGLERMPLFSDRFGVVCRTDHALAQDWDSLTWSDMAGQSFIANGLCHLIEDAGFAPILAASQMMVPSTISLLALVRAGVGVTVLPRRALPATEDLAFLPLRDARATRQVYVLHQPVERMSPAAQDLVNLIGALSFDAD